MINTQNFISEDEAVKGTAGNGKKNTDKINSKWKSLSVIATIYR